MLAAKTSALMEAIERHCGDNTSAWGERQLRPPAHDEQHPSSGESDSQPAFPMDPRHSDGMVARPRTRDRRGGTRPRSRRVHALPRLSAAYRIALDGLAAGNSRAEAVLYGLFELVERDCTAFGEVLRSGRRIKLTSLPEPALGLVKTLGNVGIDTYVYSFVSDVGIPTFFAMIDDTRSRDGLLINGGAGCHLDPTVAVGKGVDGGCPVPIIGVGLDQRTWR